MKFTFSILVAITLSSCFLFGPPSQAEKRVLYRGHFGTNETIKIIYSGGPYTPYFMILLHQNNKLVDHFEVRNVPQKFVIGKLMLFEKDSIPLYRMISDSSHSKLKCIEFNFLEMYNNENVLQTFIPVSERERKIFSTLVEVIHAKNISFQITQNEINRFLGWVRINY